MPEPGATAREVFRPLSDSRLVTPSLISVDEEHFDMPACLERVRQQDQDAARELVDHLYPLVIKIVRSRLPRRESEEDLAQEIFLKMFTHLNRYQGAVPFSHWVSRIAVNHCLNALRSRKIRPEWRWADLSEEQASALDAVLTSTTEDSHPAHAVGARELLDKLLEALDPKDQLLLRLLELEEKSIDEVKKLTGWSAVRIRVRAFRARKKLNRRFGRLKEEGKL